MCAKAAIGRLNRTAMDACREGRLDEAEIKLILTLAKTRAAGARCFEAKVANNLGVVYELKGCFSKAQHYYGESLRIYESKLGSAHAVSERIARSLARVRGQGA